jgi:hypothetical protein
MTASQPLPFGASQPFFSEMGSIMKFLKRTVLASAHQELTSRQQWHTPLVQLRRWISTIHTVLSSVVSSNIFQQLSSKSSPPDITTAPPLMLSNSSNVSWIKTAQLLPSLIGLIMDRSRADHQALAAQAVLCVGGRAAFYADYRQLIEAAGGYLMVFRSSTQDNVEYLLALLERVNIVICPVDCIHHTDFLVVRQYCQRTGKYCLMLQRSDLATFSKAVATSIQNNMNPRERVIKIRSDNDYLPTLSTTGALTG